MIRHAPFEDRILQATNSKVVVLDKGKQKGFILKLPLLPGTENITDLESGTYSE